MKPTHLLFVFILSAVVPGKVAAQLVYSGVNLDINNVSARINNHLGHFWDPVTQNQQYEIPSGSNKHTIFAGNLWIGGFDPGDSLHQSAQTYNQLGQVGFYPGPLDTATGVAANPQAWNLIWKVSKNEILNHISNWNTPGYIMPNSIATWPGNPAPGSNYLHVLAPFYDFNNNGVYEPAAGDFPFIQGDQAVYFICNDSYGINSLGVPSLGVEIHGMAYGFDAPGDPALDNSVFMNYQIANFSGINYDSVAIGLWTDFEIGDASDDFVATDVPRNMVYGFNGDPSDGVYGANIPAQGLMILNHTLDGAFYYDNVNNVYNGNPSTAYDYYNYLHSTYLNNSPLTFGTTGIPCNYSYPGNTDPAFSGQNWSMSSAGILPGDVRMLASMQYPVLDDNGFINLDFVYITAFPGLTSTAVQVLGNYADDIKDRYDTGNLTALFDIPAFPGLTVYPSVTDDFVTFSWQQQSPDEQTIVSVYSVDGKLVQQHQQHLDKMVMVNLSQCSPGLYIINLSNSKGSTSQKVIRK